jgi:hypothetical protein
MHGVCLLAQIKIFPQNLWLRLQRVFMPLRNSGTWVPRLQRCDSRYRWYQPARIGFCTTSFATGPLESCTTESFWLMWLRAPAKCNLLLIGHDALCLWAHFCLLVLKQNRRPLQRRQSTVYRNPIDVQCLSRPLPLDLSPHPHSNRTTFLTPNHAGPRNYISISTCI